MWYPFLSLLQFFVFNVQSLSCTVTILVFNVPSLSCTVTILVFIVTSFSCTVTIFVFNFPSLSCSVTVLVFTVPSLSCPFTILISTVPSLFWIPSVQFVCFVLVFFGLTVPLQGSKEKFTIWGSQRIEFRPPGISCGRGGGNSCMGHRRGGGGQQLLAHRGWEVGQQSHSGWGKVGVEQ